MSISTNKKKYFNEILKNENMKINLIDVGSGGLLKAPWNLIPDPFIDKVEIEPTGNNPICISNKTGKGNCM